MLVQGLLLFSNKPLPRPVLTYCQFDPWGQISVTLESKCTRFLSGKFVWKCRLQKRYIQSLSVQDASEQSFQLPFQFSGCIRPTLYLETSAIGNHHCHECLWPWWCWLAIWKEHPGLLPVGWTYTSIKWKKDVTPLLTHWNYVFLARTHRYVLNPGDVIILQDMWMWSNWFLITLMFHMAWYHAHRLTLWPLGDVAVIFVN